VQHCVLGKNSLISGDRTTGETARSEKLHDSERSFRLLVQSVVDYAIYMIEPDGIVATWNSGAERIKGYAAREIVGKNYAEFFTPEDRVARLPNRALEVAREQGHYESEGWRVRKDGTRFWAHAVLDAVRDEAGQIIGFAKITRDMTERREAQQRLQLAQEQLAQSQKMEAIGHLTGGIAHDFNNLLMIVKGQAQLLRMRAKDARDIRALDAIDQAAGNGANLTRQLLTFSRRQTLNRITVDLAERFKGFRDLLIGCLGANVDLDMDIGPEVWPVVTDLGEFELALVNIAVNARDAMPTGGCLRIRARNATLPEGNLPLSGDYVALSLSDNGMGIPKEILGKVFEPFFTTKEVGRGTGLGLSQVFGFAHQSGGDVRIASEPDVGTTVTLYLPRSHNAVTPLSSEKIEGDVLKGCGRVLVVEDNNHVGDVSRLLLEQLGYCVHQVESPAEALNALSGKHDFALILSDIVMPGEMDGLTLARAVRDRWPQIPMLLTTGYSSAAERVGAEFPIIRKPFDINTLGVAVKLALADGQRQAVPL
jgi:PAS domain S-box-containing protein